MKKVAMEMMCVLLGVFLLLPAFAVGFAVFYIVSGFTSGMQHSSNVFGATVKTSEEKEAVA